MKRAWPKSMLRMKSKKKKLEGVPVYLNVYDMTPANDYLHWFGLGVYHSGVQVNGVEYFFCGEDDDETGVNEMIKPKEYEPFTFRKSILVGRTDLGAEELDALVQDISKEYMGRSYQVISKNCNHFSNEFAKRLTSKPIPRRINRVARLCRLCKCRLPEEYKETTKVCENNNVSTTREAKQVEPKSSTSKPTASSAVPTLSRQ